SLDEGRFEAVSDHSARRTGFKRPLLDFATRIFDIKKEPRMRIFQPDLRDHTFDGDWLIRIEYRRERVMRECRHNKCQQYDARDQYMEPMSFHAAPQFRSLFYYVSLVLRPLQASKERAWTGSRDVAIVYVVEGFSPLLSNE